VPFISRSLLTSRLAAFTVQPTTLKGPFLTPPVPAFTLPKTVGPTTTGETDEALRCFWYRPLLRRSSAEPTQDSDWGIHVNADCLAELSAEIATAMERDGVANAPDLSLDLAFIFGFDHEYFHHLVDSGCTAHILRLHAQTGEMPPQCDEYAAMYERRCTARDDPHWWFIVEEALANAHVARDPSRLGGLNEAFMRYGLLPQPDDLSRGPYALWEQPAMDARAFRALSHMLWMQMLNGELDPLGAYSGIEAIVHEGGLEAAFDRVVDAIVEAAEPQDDAIDGGPGNGLMGGGTADDPDSRQPSSEDGGRSEDWLEDRDGVRHLIAFGGFDSGLLRRLQVPLRWHGGHGPEFERRFGPDNPDWPYGTIERLYEHFRQAEVSGESDDPFASDDDDDYELTP